MDAWNRADPTLLINILAPKEPPDMTTSTSTSNVKRIISLASYSIASGLLRVTLTHGAARRWGAHLPEGTDTPDAAEYRRQARRILEQKARDEGCVSVEIATAPYRGQSVTLDVFDLT